MTNMKGYWVMTFISRYSHMTGIDRPITGISTGALRESHWFIILNKKAKQSKLFKPYIHNHSNVWVFEKNEYFQTHSSGWRAWRVCRCLLTAEWILVMADSAETKQKKKHSVPHCTLEYSIICMVRDSHCKTEPLWSVCRTSCTEFPGKCPFLQTSAKRRSAWQYLKHNSINAIK